MSYTLERGLEIGRERGANRIHACAAAVAKGLAPEGWSVGRMGEGLPIPGPFFPICFSGFSTAYGFWLLGANTPVRVTSLHFDGWAAADVGQTGLLLALRMMDAATSLGGERELCRLAAVLFSDRDRSEQEALARAVLRGEFDAYGDPPTRLPLVKHLWSDAELPVANPPSALARMFARNEQQRVRPRPGRRLDALRAATAKGDVPAALDEWAEPGWSFDEAKAGLDALTPLLPPDLVVRLREKLEPAAYGPVDGY